MLETSITHLHDAAQIHYIKEYLTEVATKFYKNTINHANPEIAEITRHRTHSVHKQPYENLQLEF